MDNISTDNRGFKRFDIKFPAKIESGSNKSSLRLYTRDISSSGAFFYTVQPFKEGIRVKIEIILENNTLRRLTGSQSHIQALGIIVRCESEGMAVRFNNHKIKSLITIIN
jgi:hypothetical protein